MDYAYDINIASYRLTPVTKRLDVRLSFLECIGAPLQRIRDNFFETYLTGSANLAWDISSSYVKYDRVNYQNKIYECLKDTTGSLPTDRSFWVLVTGDFRGAVERIKYNCQTIMLEYILNKWFGTTFRQPAIGVPSDIYIVNNSRDSSLFLISENRTFDGIFIASKIAQQEAQAEEWIGETATYSLGANFTVYYPIALIPTTTDDRYYQMTSLINKYKIFGSTADYISY